MKQYHNKQHFSHEHILTPLQLEPGEEINCAACDELISNPFYGCIDCNFFLHQICSDAPRSMVHPSHPTHPLTLHQSSTYPSRTYGCDACGSNGKGFSFSCAHCQFDLHILCAGLAPTFLFKKEHPHEFKLVCEPDITNKLMCYICNLGNQGYWLYYCGACRVGAHVNCLSAKHEEKGKITTNDDNSKTEKQVPVKGISSSSPSVSEGRKVEAAPPGNKTEKQVPVKGESSSSPSVSGVRRVEAAPPLGNAAATRQQQGGNAATTEAQRRLLEDRLAKKLILDALDAAADYVGPPYTRGYYYY